MNAMNPLIILAQAAPTTQPPATDPWLTLFVNFFPLILIFGVVFIALRKNNSRVARSLQNQEDAIRLNKEHFARTEALLERIAAAVEKKN